MENFFGFRRRWGVPGGVANGLKTLGLLTNIILNTTKIKNLFQRGPIFYKKKKYVYGLQTLVFA